MNKGNFINVTRWINREQEFVEVGTLFWDDSLGRANPLVGFDYLPEYLEKHPRLLPFNIEGDNGKTIVGKTEHNDMIPNYFKQFLPSEHNKVVFKHTNSDFLNFSQFEQIKYVASFKGTFGAIQLNYDNEGQSKSLPKLDSAIELLEELNAQRYGSLDNNALNALYHPNSDEPVVSTFQEVGGKYFDFTLKKCRDEEYANKLLLIRDLMIKGGANCAVVLKVAGESGNFYVAQTTGEQVIDKNGGEHLMYNTLPVSVLLADSERFSHFEKLNYTHINSALTEAIGENVSKQLLTVALFSHTLHQKSLNDQHIKIKEKSYEKWVLAEHEIVPVEISAAPFQISLSDTISAYDAIEFDDKLVKMLSKNFELSIEDVQGVITKISAALINIDDLADKRGLSRESIAPEIKLIKQSNILGYAKQLFERTNKPQSDDSHGMDF